MKNKIGISIIIIGILHVCLGFVKYQTSFMNIFSQSVFNSIKTHEEKLAFWFTFCGIIFMLLGYLIYLLEKHQIKIPKRFSWSFLASTILGVIILPVSGFWILLIPSILIVITSYAKRRIAS